MELRQLEYLVAVIEEANFTRAAERVRVSQSGISAQIRQLERELGQQLLDRSTRTVRATDAGAAMLPFARAALGAVSGAKLAVDEVTGLLAGRLDIGMVTACSIGALFDLLADFHDAHPGVDIRLSEDRSDRLVGRVLDGTVDLALVGTAGALPDGLFSVPLIDESLIAAVPERHPLASRPSTPLASLADHRIITMPIGTGIRSAFDGACRDAGISPRIAFEASTGDAILRLARRGLGVAILSESMVPADDMLQRVMLTGPQPTSRIDFVWRAGSGTAGAAGSPAARALVTMLESR
jgi:DNA-binding transcriptional LysR family regulator